MFSRSHFVAWIYASLIPLVISPIAAIAQTPPPILNYLPGGSDLAARPPELFTSLNTNLFVAVDPLDSTVVVFRSTGQIAGKSSALSFFPTSIREYPDRLEFVSADNRRYATLRRTVSPEQIATLDEAVGAVVSLASRATMRQKNSRTIEIRIAGPRSVTLAVRGAAAGTLSSVRLLGSDAASQHFVQISEIARTVPRLEMRVSVLRYSASGKAEAIADVPIDGMDGVPSRFLALSERGAITALIPTKTGVQLQPLTFRLLGNDQNGAAAAPSAPTDLSVNVVPQDSGLPDQTSDAPPVIRPTTRAEIIMRARSYLNIRWVLDAENFLRSGVDNNCAKAEGKFWARPKRLTENMVGKEINFTPYFWGGNDTPERFLAKISEGALAGSVCTCREAQYNYCQVDFAAGVDCSGFVTRAWGVSKYGTSNLGLVATPVSDITKVRPGDAFNKPGSHVRLVVGVRPGPDLRFDTMESATNLRCEGVCAETYSLAELSGYTPMRFNGVQE